jgi:alkanesulfonate monooxygenase SsuD/methylene tetrahydromethanopterin reductase-like flavin-dependent oxidoreductase (luciferase family)
MPPVHVATSETQHTRRTTNPLFNANRLKLGTFCTNVSNGSVATTAEGSLELTWRNTLAIAQASDRAGFEAVVPLGRWRGYGGVTNFNGRSFEGLTWAAGLAQATSYSALLSTSHVPHFHPTLLAKQASTVDHISGGRFGLNIVSGGDPHEFAMFGGTLRPHDQAYEYAEEWTQVLLKLWTAEEPFDFDGRYFHLKGAISQPTPIQKPYPAIMCAASSPVGMRFTARYADLSFVNFMSGDLEEWQADVNAAKRLARSEFGRELSIWTKAFVVCRPTQREADEYYDYACIEKADVEGDPTHFLMGKDERKEIRDAKGYIYKHHGAGAPLRRNPGWPGHPLVGTPEQVAARLEKLSRAGIDGCLLFWVDFEREQQQFIDEVLPLLEQAGLRQPFRPAARAQSQ